MKFLILQLVAIFGLARILLAEDLNTTSLTPGEQVEVKQKLVAFERGQITLTNLTDSQEWSLKIIKYFVSHTNEVTTKMKLPVSRSFAEWNKYPEAAELAEEYLNVYSNDWRGWRVLGGAKVMMKSYDEAIAAMTNAIRLGDDENYVSLGGAALSANRLDIFENMAAPNLLVLMNDTKRFPKDERFEMRCVLILYAITADKQEVFVKAIEGLEAKEILSNESLMSQITYGCDIFKGKDIEKIRQRLGIALGANSKTNADSNPSP